MDSDVIANKLESLRRCITRLRAKTPASADVLSADLDTQDIVCLNLERAVQVCVDIAMHILADIEAPAPDTMADAFVALAQQGIISESTAARMVKAAGFRNVAVHEYQELDWNIVYAILTRHLDDFVQYAREIEAASGGCAL